MIQNIFSLPTYCNIFDPYRLNKINPIYQTSVGRTVYHYESALIHRAFVVSLTGYNVAPI